MQKIYFNNALHISIAIEWSKVWIRCHRLSYSNIGTPMLIHSNRDGGGKPSEKEPEHNRICGMVSISRHNKKIPAASCNCHLLLDGPSQLHFDMTMSLNIVNLFSLSKCLKCIGQVSRI